jgi:hypothetical protein
MGETNYGWNGIRRRHRLRRRDERKGKGRADRNK